MLSVRFGGAARERLRHPDRVFETLFSSYDRSKVPTRLADDIDAIARYGEYWLLPGEITEPASIASAERRRGLGDRSYVEWGLNKRHLEDYDERLETARLDDVLAVGITASLLVRRTLFALGEFRPATFTINASVYEPDPSRWPATFGFSVDRAGSFDWLERKPYQAENQQLQQETNDNSFDCYLRLGI